VNKERADFCIYRERASMIKPGINRENVDMEKECASHNRRRKIQFIIKRAARTMKPRLIYFSGPRIRTVNTGTVIIPIR
jgi:hypothetical protein